jgi:hypothetical protein
VTIGCKPASTWGGVNIVFNSLELGEHYHVSHGSPNPIILVFVSHSGNFLLLLRIDIIITGADDFMVITYHFLVIRAVAVFKVEHSCSTCWARAAALRPFRIVIITANKRRKSVAAWL